MTIQQQPDERARFRRQRSEQAIQLAMQNRWEEALSVNQSILELFPNDVDAFNRIGKALMEMGRFTEARNAYSKAVEYDPNNAIALRNLNRLGSMTEPDEPTVATPNQVDPRLFIEETGKTGVTTLLNPGSRETLSQLMGGEPVQLQIDGKDLKVLSSRNQLLGMVEPKLALRLISLMRGGNKYAAGVTALNGQSIEIIIRETYQHPTQVGKVSFPTRGGAEAGFRPYTRDSLVRYDAEEEEENPEDTDYNTDWEEEADQSVQDEVSLEFEEEVHDKDDDYDNE